MKKVYLSIIACAFALASTAQHDIEATLVTPVSGSSVSGGVVTVNFDLINNGPNDLVAGDTIYFGYTIGTTPYDLTGASGSASGSILTANVPMGQGLSTGDFTVDLSGAADGESVCGIIYGMGSASLSTGDPNETDPTNNTDCFTVQNTSAISELSFENAVSVVTTNNFVTISSDNIENLDYNVYDLSGKVVASGEFNSTVQLETGNFNAGIYIVNVSNGTERKSVKVAIR